MITYSLDWFIIPSVMVEFPQINHPSPPRVCVTVSVTVSTCAYSTCDCYLYPNLINR